MMIKYWLFAVITIALIISDLFAQSSFRIKNRIQIGLEIDDNIKESRFNPQAQPGLRLLFQSKVDHRKADSRFALDYSAGFQGYDPDVREDKLISEASARFERQFGKWFLAGVDAWMRMKIFLHNSIDYHIFSPSAFSRINLPLQANFSVFARPQVLDYWSSSVFDFSGYEIGSTLLKRFSRRFVAELGASQTHRVYQRSAYDRPLSDYFVLILDERQQDAIRKYWCQLQYMGQIYASIHYFYESNASNSYGFSYQNQAMTLSLSRKLSGRMLLRIHAMLQKKKYQETWSAIVPVELDTEKEDSNFLILDLSRSLTERYSAFLRLAIYRNESPYRSLYYRKQLITGGLEYTF